MSRFKLFLKSVFTLALSIFIAPVNAAENKVPLEQLWAGLEKINVESIPQLLELGDTPVHFIFLDARCPHPHFPDCEALLQKVRSEYGGNEPWLAITNSFYMDVDSAANFFREYKLRLPALFDAERRLFERFEVFSTPYLITLSRDGELLYRGQDFSRLKTAPE